MKILIDIGHPGHVHLFKNFAWEMQNKGHEILFTTREKEFEIDLLNHYKFNFISFGKKYNTIVSKIFGLFKFNVSMLKAAIKFKPDVFMSHGSIYAAQTSWLINKPHISFEDTFNFEQINLYKPFTDVILTSSYDHPNLGKKNVKYRGYHELAYLHPNNFQPNNSNLSELRISENTKYVLLRFVSWEASHDKGHKGISFQNKLKAVKEFKKYAKVYISSEKKLPEELLEYQIRVSPEKIHDILAFASLVFGESATMISEAAVLGTPGIFLDDTGRLYTEEEEKKYGLVYNYTESEIDQDNAIKKGVEILKKNDNSAYQRNRGKLLSDKIDVTAFTVWFVENYPDSIKILSDNSNYQIRFK